MAANASLVIYARTADGWRRGSIVFTDGTVKPGVMSYSGMEHPTINPVFQIRTYIGGRAIYTNAGADYDAAKALLDWADTTRQREAQNKALGINIPLPPKPVQPVAPVK